MTKKLYQKETYSIKKTVIIIAVVLVTVGILLFAGVCIAIKFDFTKFDTVTYETNTYTADKDFRNIEINVSETDILFKPSTDSNVSVVCVENDKVKHSVSVEKETLHITVDDKRHWYDHITIFSQPFSMTVYLPSEKYELLKIDSSTRNITIPNLFSFKNADITASTGSIDCNASVKEIFRGKTSTGAIQLDKMEAENIDLNVSTGNISIGSVSCKDSISAKTSTGKVTLTDVTCQNFTSTGSTGNVTLKDTIASEKFIVERSTGNIHFENCDAEQIDIKTSTGDVKGTLNSEKIFTTKTSTGTVHVPETVSGGKCKITTSTGDIHIDLSINR